MRISDWSSDVCSSDLGVIWSGIRLSTRALPSTMIGPGVAAGGCTRSADAGDGKAAMHAETMASFFIIRRSVWRTAADRHMQAPSCAADTKGNGGQKSHLPNTTYIGISTVTDRVCHVV